MLQGATGNKGRAHSAWDFGCGWYEDWPWPVLVLGGVFVGVCAASLATADYAVAQTASSIVVEGNRRVESDTIRSYFRLGPGERLDAAKVDEGVKALFATGLFQDVRRLVRATA